MTKRIADLLPYVIGGSEKFQRNFKSLAGANAIAQILGVVTLPLLTRLFSPEDFGLLAIYTACQSVLLAVASARIEWLVPNARNRAEAIALIGLGMIALAITCLSVFLVTLMFKDLLGSQLGVTSENTWIFILLPLGVLAGGLQLLIQSWHVYQTELKIVGRSKLAQSFSTLLLSLLSGLGGVGVSGLLLSYISGFWVAVGVLLNRQKDFFRLMKCLSQQRIKRVFANSNSEVLLAVLLGIVNVCMHMGMIFLLSIAYDAKTVGLYSLVFRLSTAPVGLFTSAIAQSFWADAAKLVKTNRQELRDFYIRSTLRLGILATGLCIALAIFAQFLVIIFGGAEWIGADNIQLAILPYIFAITVFSPTTHLIVYGKQGLQLFSDLSTLFLGVISFFYVANMGLPAWMAVLAMSCAYLIGYVFRFFLHLHCNRTIQTD